MDANLLEEEVMIDDMKDKASVVRKNCNCLNSKANGGER